VQASSGGGVPTMSISDSKETTTEDFSDQQQRLNISSTSPEKPQAMLIQI
jgi:hypothetical protein